MTDSALITAIKASAAAMSAADAGNDATVAATINATFPVPAPVTVPALANAAPNYLASIAATATYLQDMEVIASRVRDGDSAGIGTWASTLLLIGKMTQPEHDAVKSLVVKAASSDSVDSSQVSRVLQPARYAQHDGQALPLNWSAV